MTDWHADGVMLMLGDCLERLPEIESESVDAVITDPPYPCIKRKYGTWTVDEWWEMIVEGVVPEVRRILKPTGSAVFILQPNSEHVGQMRGWLWEFMAWVCREWNMVQDVWWWNTNMIPCGGATTGGLLRGSLKACVWCGACECFRNQGAVLLDPTDDNAYRAKLYARTKGERINSTSGHSVVRKKSNSAWKRRGGVTPFNVQPIGVSGAGDCSAKYGHGAGTPLRLADWWTRYIVPEGGTVCDPFVGSGTMGVAAVQNGCNFVGIEKLDEPGYFPTAQERIAEALAQPRQLPMGEMG